jgi:FixJ family two-component response regulator
VDDEAPVRKALTRLLVSAGHQVAAFATPKEFMQQDPTLLRGCALFDVSMPEVTGLELQVWLAKADSHLPIIFLTGRGDIATSVRAMKGGAVDFLTKPVDAPVLLAAVAESLRREALAWQARSETRSAQERLAQLTPREREVLDHVVAGRLNKQIAATLGTVEKTIKVHRGRVMQKLEVRSVADLVRLTERATPPRSTS